MMYEKEANNRTLGIIGNRMVSLLKIVGIVLFINLIVPIFVQGTPMMFIYGLGAIYAFYLAGKLFYEIFIDNQITKARRENASDPIEKLFETPRKIELDGLGSYDQLFSSITEDIPNNLVLMCLICKININSSEQISQCRSCNAIFHKEHLQLYITEQLRKKSTFNCPVCKLSNKELTIND